MGVLEQIENIMINKIKGKNDNLIEEHLIKLILGDVFYHIRLYDGEFEVFKSKETMADWLNKKGWNIFPENKS